MQGQQELEAGVVRTLTWRVVPFLFLLYIVAYLDRINIGFAALQMQQQLAFTDAVYGLGAGVFSCGGAAASFGCAGFSPGAAGLSLGSITAMT